jgi:hypothetical protein
MLPERSRDRLECAMTDYVDVFISHKQEDAAAAERLRDSIVGQGYTCYTDTRDRHIGRIVSARKKAERLRKQLRGCRSLIYLYSPRAIESKWMPWELGFFDGRWGSVPVGLYFTATEPRQRKGERRLQETFSVQEYLEMYERVDEASLADFLRRTVSNTALLNRADVDVDRWMTLLSGAMRNPLDFYLGCLQYATGVAQQMTGGQGGAQQPFVAQLEQWLGELRRMSGSQQVASPAFAKATDLALKQARKAHDAGQYASVNLR